MSMLRGEIAVLYVDNFKRHFISQDFVKLKSCDLI
ncbi:MAG: hypothetical protein RLZ33_2985 [Bacteroidota bacterium]|jgi:hypothetical protein